MIGKLIYVVVTNGKHHAFMKKDDLMRHIKDYLVIDKNDHLQIDERIDEIEILAGVMTPFGNPTYYDFMAYDSLTVQKIIIE